MQKNNLYDALPATINRLKVVMQLKNNELKKSLEEFKTEWENDSFEKAETESIFKGFNNVVDAEIELCKSLHTQIDVLQQDYVAGRINHIRFIDNLRPLKNFLNEKMEYCPTHLKQDKMQAIVNQYL